MLDDKKRISATIRDYLARERLSREQFAFKTKLGKSTVDKLLVGLFSDKTLAIVESHTRLALRSSGTQPSAGLRTVRSVVPNAAQHPSTQPSIVVLPFRNLNGDPAQDFLSDGLSEDIIAALARLRWLFVIARNSSFAYKDRTIDIREIARELGVRYVLEGSVRTAGEQIRIIGQLSDAETGKHLWAQKYDRDRQDIFAVQDQITERVVAAVEPHLYEEEGYRAVSCPPESIDAWSLVVRGMGLINRIGRSQNDQAQELLRRAVALDPKYSKAHALLGWAVRWSAHCNWHPNPQEGHIQAAAHAQDALKLDPTEPWARMVLGLPYSNAGEHERALSELGAGINSNPSFALGHTALGWGLLRAGWFDEAIGETDWALRLSPADSFSGLYTSIHALALLGARRFEEALPFLRTSVAAFDEYQGHYNQLVSCCGHLGLRDEAQEFIAASNRIGPPLTLSSIRAGLSKFAHCEVFVEGLRKAGVPE